MVVHITQPTTAGVAVCVERLARRQQADGDDVLVVCPSEGDLAAHLRAAGVRVVVWEATRGTGRQVIGEVRALRRVLREQRVPVDAVVHLHSSKAGLVGRLVLRGRRPTIFQPHGWSFLAASGPLARAAVAWERLATRWTDSTVCVSTDERTLGQRHGIAGPYAVVPNAVPLPERAATDADRAAARTRLGLDPGAPTVVCVGRLTRQKGQDVLLDAWPGVVQVLPSARLHLVGDGDLHDVLAARKVPGVHLAGWSDRTDDWLAAANVVAAPSRWEGMSLTVLEAAALGRTVVAADAAGMRDVLLEGDHPAGAVVPVEDAAALATALILRLLDPALAEREGTAGHREVARRFSTEAAHRATARLVEALRTGPPHPPADADHQDRTDRQESLT